MRLYTFTNFYLSSIQQGIQPLHLVGNMAVRYHSGMHSASIAAERFFEWAEFHKTVICLNGGAHEHIATTFNELQFFEQALHLPVGDFHEDQMSLGGIRTCCGIVVPADIYGEMDNVRTYGTYKGWAIDHIPQQLLNEYKLLEKISSHSLAK